MSRAQWAGLALLMMLGIAGVSASYTQLNYSGDERFHIWCGWEWWNHKRYTRETLHPPLARVMTAALAYHNGAAFKSLDIVQSNQLSIFFARLGVLPFYILSMAVVFAWSRYLFGIGAGLWALAFYITLPTVTAHAALANTDMGYAATFVWALYAFVRWMERPTIPRTLLLGLSSGLMFTTKFSALVQWPAAIFCILLLQLLANYRQALPLNPIHRRHLITGAVVALPIILLVVGVFYRFSYEQFFLGVKALWMKNRYGHAIWMWGPLNNKGVWYFFPVAFFFKTPIAFHILTFIGHFQAIRTAVRGEHIARLFPLAAALAVLVSSMPSNINIGVRHVLHIYPLLAIGAGAAAYWLWQHPLRKRLCVVALLLWQVQNFVTHYPDRISYFNELAGSRPENITVDSDFDWGQYVSSLYELLKKRHVSHFFMCERWPLGPYRQAIFYPGLKPQRCSPIPASGWVVSTRSVQLLQPYRVAWLKRYHPVDRLPLLDLYYIPPWTIPDRTSYFTRSSEEEQLNAYKQIAGQRTHSCYIHNRAGRIPGLASLPGSPIAVCAACNRE